MLKGKRVVLVGPAFYSYPKIIQKEIERMGGQVHFYDERNNPNSLEKVALRKFPFLMRQKMKKYYHAIALKEKEFQPDYVLFISPESITRDIVCNLKSEFTKAEFILYMWDSIENKNARDVYDMFDKYISFDPHDCKKYGFAFRPLFFSWAYNTEPAVKNDFQYDFGFIGTAHSDRAKILYFVQQYCKAHDKRWYYYIYTPGKLMLIANYILDKYFRKLYAQGLVHTQSIEQDEVEKIMAGTRYVIDVNDPKQTGLTMRTIEMLGLRKKLLTTNAHIKEYDFYQPGNQLVLDRQHIQLDESLMNEPYQEIDQKVYEKYRIDQWVRDIFAD